MVYSWKYPLAVPAQEAGEYLSELEKEKGKLTPELYNAPRNLDKKNDENKLG